MRTNPFYTKCFIALIFLLFPAITYSQMFSIEEPERRVRPATNALTFGLDYIDMSFRPDLENNPEVYDFNEPVYRLRLDMPGMEVYLGYKNSIGDAGENADTLNYFNIGANVSGAMPVAGNRNVGLIVPIWLSTDFTQVRSTQTGQPESEQFRQSSASVGIGAGAFARFSDRIRLRVDFVPQIGFTVTSFGSDSGQMGSLNGRVRMHVDQVLGRFGLIAGYNYNWRRYSGGQERFQYDIVSHNVSAGITF